MVGMGRRGRDGAYLQGGWSKSEVRSRETGQGGGALAAPSSSYVTGSLSPAATSGGGSWGPLGPKRPESQQSVPAPWGSSSPQDVLSGVRLAAGALLTARVPVLVLGGRRRGAGAMAAA